MKKHVGIFGEKLSCAVLVLMLSLSIPFFSCDDSSDRDSSTRTKYNGYVQDVDGSGKYMMHLEGSPYKIGYSMGYLRPHDVERMCSIEFYKGVIMYLLGADAAQTMNIDVDSLAKTLIDTVAQITLRNKKNVPLEYIQEMQGIADGVRAAVPDTKLTFNDVFTLNLAMDQVLSIVYPIMVPLMPLGDLNFHSCNGFVAFGDATVDGRVLMGRDFMFSAEVFHEVALLVEYVPESGNRFVSVTCPGFVGVTAAMNDKGVGIGMDMISAMDNNPSSIGIGTLLLARKTIQYSNKLDEAVKTISSAKRGVPWAYIIGDSRGKGAVVETSAHYVKVRYADYKQPYSAICPKQIENKDDLVVVSNHYLTPYMNLFGLQYAQKDSLWRYKTLVNLLLDEYGMIDDASGRELINYLQPPNYGYYGDDPDTPVAASVTLFDLTNLEMWSLYGLYSDEWVNFKFKRSDY